MKKILILSYFFPPSNFAGSYRVVSFAKYLHKFGYYPIVITRQAPDNAGTFREMAKDCGKEIIHQQNEGYEVFYLPYKGNLRDRIYAAYGDEKYVFFRKILSFLEMFLQGISVKSLPYSNIYYFAKLYLKKNKDIDLVLCSGKPYQLFLFAHLLKKKYGVRWVADYRDEWNSFYINYEANLSSKEKLSFFSEFFQEKKWTKNSDLITTVTEQWANNLSCFTKKPTKVILNGHDIHKPNCPIAQEQGLKIVHLGSLYNYQPVEIFIHTIVKLLEKGYNIKCLFPGIDNAPENINRIGKAGGQFSNSFVMMPRLKQDKVAELMHEADAFLMVGYHNVKGWMSSKVLEYLPWHKPIILCPSGNEELELLLNKHSKTFISNTEEALEKDVVYIYENKSRLKEFNPYDEAYSKQFSREKQASILANHLDKIGEVNYENIKVLCFHRVSNEKSPAYPPMPVKVFERLIKYFKKRYEIVGFDSIHLKTKKPKLIITFDDGYEDFFTNVFPIIKKHHIKTVLSVIPSLAESGKCPWSQVLNKCIEAAFKCKIPFEIPEIQIKETKINASNIEKIAVKVFHKLSGLDTKKVEEIIDRLSVIYNPELTPMLSWAQIEKIYKSGVVDIASYSMTHCALTQISDKQLLYNEILTSKKIIEEKLATEIKIFTPPGSFYNRSIEDLVFKNGYEFLLNVDDCCWNTSRKIVSRILMPYTSFYKNLLVSNQLIQKIKKLRHLFFS